MKYWILLFGAAAVVSAQVSTGNPLRCSANAGVPPLIRAEGRAELAGDYVVECTGGVAGTRISASISFLTNVSITSKRVGDKTEALLLVDEPYLPRSTGPGAPAVVGVNVFQGTSTAPNVVTFSPVLTAPGLNEIRVLRFTNIRVNATELGASATLIPLNVVASVSAGSAFTIDNPLQAIAFVLRGGIATLLPGGPNGSGRFGLPACNANNASLLATPSALGSTVDFVLRFREGFQSSWRPRLTARERSTPGSLYYDESGYLDNSFPATDGLNQAGVPTTGTRLIATIANIPAGMAIFATPQPIIRAVPSPSQYPNGPKVRMLRAAAGGHDPSTAVTATTTAGYNGYQVGIAPVPLANGAATLVWEVDDVAYGGIDSLGFGLVVAYAANTTPVALNMNMSLGPHVMPGPEQFNTIPRFQSQSGTIDSIPIYACDGFHSPDITSGSISRSAVPGSANLSVPLQVSFSVRNNGTAAAGPFDYTVSVVNSAGQTTAFTTNRIATGIQPYAATETSTSLALTSSTVAGAHTLRISLDSASEVLESNETNNVVEFPLNVGCGQRLTMRTLTLPAAGGTVPIPIEANCGFAIMQKPDWIQVAGNNFVVPPNNTGQLRTGAAQLGYAGFVTLSQPSMPVTGCTVTLTDAVPLTPDSGSKRNITLSTGPQCAWTAGTNTPWLQVFPIQGTGPATLQLTVFPNFGRLPRTGQIESNGGVIDVRQAASFQSADLRAVRQIYFNFFGRLPSEEESAYQKAQLEVGVPLAELIERFWISMEFGSGGRFVAGLYVGLLNRDAEYGGWLFQRNAMSTGIVDHGRLVENFVGSAEFRLNNGVLSDLDLIKLLYRQILLRPGNQSEWDFHLSTLRTGRVTRNQMIENFLNSAEFRSGTGPRLTAFLLYAAVQNREPNPQEFEQMKTRVAAGTPLRQLISELVSGFNQTLE